MDNMVKQILEGFGYSVSSYSSSLGADNAKVKRAVELMQAITTLAENGADISAITMDPGFGELGVLIGALASEPVPENIEAAPSPVPAAGIAAAGYHMAWESMGTNARASQEVFYNRIFAIEDQAEDAIHFNTLLKEDGVLFEMARQPLVKIAEETLKQAETAHSPAVDYQQQLAIQTFTNVTTVAELEYHGTLMAELSNVEHVWDAMFIEAIGLLPGCAQAIEAFGPSEDNVTKLRNSHRFSAEFMGITWDTVFNDPRYLLFWNKVFWPAVPEEKRAKYNVSTAEGWRDLLKTQFYDPFVKDEPAVSPDPEKAQVRFWNKDYSVHKTLDLLGNPPRPEFRME